MRSFVNSNIQVLYPEALAFSLDNNFITVRNQYGQFQLEVEVQITINAMPVIIYKYTSEIGFITFNLSPLIKAYWNNFNFSIKLIINTSDGGGTIYNDFTAFNFITLHGKTMQERHHGSCRIITYHQWSDVQNCDLFKPQGWTGTIQWIGYVYNANVNDMQRLSINLHNQPVKGLNFNGNNSVYSGEIWDEEYSGNWNIRLQQVCPTKNGIKIQYYDLDGCRRYAIGEVLSKKMATSRDEYRRGGSVFDDVPYSKVNGYSGTIDVGFQNVRPEQYLEDIMLSPEITTTRGTELISIIPTTLQLVRDGKEKDIVITFKIDM